MSTPEQQQEQRELQDEVGEARRLMEVGMDVEAFMKTPAGRYIQARANKELEEAQDALVDAALESAEGRAAAQEHQLKARVAQRLLTYLGDIVQEGKNAERSFRGAHDID
ncbi:MAG: hypothetical protein KAZ23_01960 [Burkholderiaceae bacterium]|nr:hypothetical protein [Burkholderiaceae bacterium]